MSFPLFCCIRILNSLRNWCTYYIIICHLNSQKSIPKVLPFLPKKFIAIDFTQKKNNTKMIEVMFSALFVLSLFIAWVIGDGTESKPEEIADRILIMVVFFNFVSFILMWHDKRLGEKKTSRDQSFTSVMAEFRQDICKSNVTRNSREMLCLVVIQT